MEHPVALASCRKRVGVGKQIKGSKELLKLLEMINFSMIFVILPLLPWFRGDLPRPWNTFDPLYDLLGFDYNIASLQCIIKEYISYLSRAHS